MAKKQIRTDHRNVRCSDTDRAHQLASLRLALQHLHQLHGITRFGHLLHHFLGLFDLVQELVHVCWSGAAPFGNTAAAASV